MHNLIDVPAQPWGPGTPTGPTRPPELVALGASARLPTGTGTPAGPEWHLELMVLCEFVSCIVHSLWVECSYWTYPGVLALQQGQNGGQSSGLLGWAAHSAAEVAQHVRPAAQPPHIPAPSQGALHRRQQLSCIQAASIHIQAVDSSQHCDGYVQVCRADQGQV